MSAIIGIYHCDGRPVYPELLGKMVEHAAPWPADAQDIWHDGKAGFGHRMLHTTPESLHEQLPLYDADHFAITADARIDNREELIAKLSLGKNNTKALSDSELILQAYKKWGEDCPKHLLGDFSFAIWDEQRRKLFCARDPMGVRPFFYYSSDRLFAFGSSIEPLLQHPEIPQQLNELRLACFLLHDLEDSVNTFYKDIVRLQGSHCLVIEDGHCRTWQYYEFDPEYELKLKSNREYEEAMREVFFEAVRCRLRSAFPVGSHLSGGLDSSSITVTARKILKERNDAPLHTFSAIFPDCAAIDPRIDERSYIHAVAELDHIIHHDVIADQSSPLMDLLWKHAEPSPGFNLYMDWLLEKNARENGVRVLLTGHDGDTTISHGYELFPELARKFRWLQLVREVRTICRVMDKPFMLGLRKLCLQQLVPDSLVKVRRIFRRNTPASGVQKGLELNPEFSRRVRMEEYQKELRNKEKAAQQLSPRQNHLAGIKSGLMTNMTEMVRFIADRAFLEISCPFFDRRMIEFSLSLPLQQKMQNGMNRSIMRRAMDGLLPLPVQSRATKGCLTVSFTHGMHEKTGSLIDDTFEKQADITKKYVDIDKFENNYQKFIREPLLVDTEAMNMFTATVAVQWLKRTRLG